MGERYLRLAARDRETKPRCEWFSTPATTLGSGTNLWLVWAYRRLSKDYEFQTDTSENMILIAMIQLMIHRLTRNSPAAARS
jgi:hypothetical protein